MLNDLAGAGDTGQIFRIYQKLLVLKQSCEISEKQDGPFSLAILLQLFRDSSILILSGRSLTSNEGTASRPTPLVQSESLARIGARSELNAICCHTTSKSASKFSWLDAFGKIPWSYLLKGQLISKCPFGVFKSTKKPTKILQGFLSQPLKRGQIKKVVIMKSSNQWYKLPLFF